MCMDKRKHIKNGTDKNFTLPNVPCNSVTWVWDLQELVSILWRTIISSFAGIMTTPKNVGRIRTISGITAMRQQAAFSTWQAHGALIELIESKASLGGPTRS